MRNVCRHLFALSLPLLLIAGCSGQPIGVIDGAGSFGSINQPIYNGSAANRPEHGAVVSLHQLSGGYVYATPFCTGTLIAEDVVLTAGHCLNAGRRKARPMDPGALAVYVGDRPANDILSHLYLVSENQIHSQFNSTKLTNDIGLIRLSSAVTESDPVANLPASLGLDSGDIGAELNFVGFGIADNGSMGVKLQVDLPLAAFGCGVTGCPDSGDAATQVSYTQSGGDGGPCSGDSGGPFFITRGSVPYVGGVTSYGDYYCTLYGVSTRVDAFEPWIAAFVGATPTPDCSADGFCNPDCTDDPDCNEPPPTDCGNGTCDADESCDGRDGTVDCSADCPGKAKGKPTGRFCFVGGTCVGPGCP
jgi:secreted trypsin-like serine protease